MIMSALPQTVQAETISGDQLTQLAAVMLGLVVFAAIFALIALLFPSRFAPRAPRLVFRPAIDLLCRAGRSRAPPMPA